MANLDRLLLRSFGQAGAKYYEVDESTRAFEVVTGKEESGSAGAGPWTRGFAELLVTGREPGEILFVALYQTGAGRFLQIGAEVYPVDAGTGVHLRLPWVGRKREFTLTQGGQVLRKFTYLYRQRDTWEEGDGDLCFWIARKVFQGVEDPPL